MNNRRNYNSIVFLTVYLGLVLVGGSPQILAQAATPRLFDIKTEIEFKDDLENKPDNEEKIDFARSLENYFDAAENFIEELIKIHQTGNFSVEFDEFRVTNSLIDPCTTNPEIVGFNDHLIRINNRSLIPLLYESKDVFSRNFLADCLENKKYKTEKAKSTELEFHYDKSELKIEVSGFKSSPKRAEYLAENFNQALRLYEAAEAETVIKSIHENTSFSFENNQVFVVTRLPRASIVGLLAVKNAQ